MSNITIQLSLTDEQAANLVLAVSRGDVYRQFDGDSKSATRTVVEAKVRAAVAMAYEERAQQ